jgi:hypothetical protein
MTDIVERLRERTAMRFMGDCKCGKCQLVPRADVAEAAALIASQAKRVAELEGALAFAGPLIEERAKQIAKGYTDAHDDEHAKGEILAAALCYLRPHATWRPPAKPANYEAVADAARAGREWYETSTLKKVIDARRSHIPNGWPWEPEAWRPKSEEADLRRAITMLMAEYHRRARATLKGETP